MGDEGCAWEMMIWFVLFVLFGVLVGVKRMDGWDWGF